MAAVDFSVRMQGASRFAQAKRRLPQIRIAPSMTEIGKWEWCVLEEDRATTSSELKAAQATRVVHANGLESDPMLACYAAVCAMREVLQRPQRAAEGEG